MLHVVSFLCILSVLGYTEVSWGIFWAIHTETKPSSIYIEIEYYMYNNKLYDAFNENKPLNQ